LRFLEDSGLILAERVPGTERETVDVLSEIFHLSDPCRGLRHDDWENSESGLRGAYVWLSIRGKVVRDVL